VFWFCLKLSSETFFILRREQDMITKVCFPHVKYPLLSDVNEHWIFLTDIWKIAQYQISWKSVQWNASCSMRTDGQTDRQTDTAKLTVNSCNFATAPKNLNLAHTFKQQLQLGLCNGESVYCQVKVKVSLCTP